MQAKDLQIGQLFRSEVMDKCVSGYRRVRWHGELLMYQSHYDEEHPCVIAIENGSDNVVSFGLDEEVIPL